jgi:hypothetical protein
MIESDLLRVAQEDRRLIEAMELLANIPQRMPQAAAGIRFGLIAPKKSDQFVTRLEPGLQGEISQQGAGFGRVRANVFSLALEFATAKKAEFQPGLGGIGLVHTIKGRFFNTFLTLSRYAIDYSLFFRED